MHVARRGVIYHGLKTGTTTERDGENNRKASIARQTLLSLKMGHKEGQLYTFTAVMFTNTKGSVHSPVQRCSAQPRHLV